MISFTNPRLYFVETAAYHQIGHAVIARSLGRTVCHEGRLVHGGAAGGYAHLPVQGIRVTTGCRSSAEIAIKVILAGPIAQYLHDPDSTDVWVTADIERASEIALSFSKSAREASLFTEMLSMQVRDELGRRWDTVMRGAQHLIEQNHRHYEQQPDAARRRHRRYEKGPDRGLPGMAAAPPGMIAE